MTDELCECGHSHCVEMDGELRRLTCCPKCSCYNFKAVPPPPRTLEQVDKDYTLEVLAFHNGNRTRAAKTLDIALRTLQRRLRRWGLQDRGVSGQKASKYDE